MQRFKNLAAPALTLLDILLHLEPECRGSASLALETDFFTTTPLPCDPSNLPKFPPSKEFDARLRNEDARRYPKFAIHQIFVTCFTYPLVSTDCKQKVGAKSLEQGHLKKEPKGVPILEANPGSKLPFKENPSSYMVEMDKVKSAKLGYFCWSWCGSQALKNFFYIFRHKAV